MNVLRPSRLLRSSAESPRQEFVIQLATLYGDLNALHPFREGNGRVQRAVPSPAQRRRGIRPELVGPGPSTQLPR
ncbi:Fic family protein [Streptomyces sp. NPDC057623]|uniref:Fic family protein n=1 Tax=Streptomyces sp. NPDC057623 TaxID=3346187 RepID=UPI0036B14C7A